jgi:hypothetical protein
MYRKITKEDVVGKTIKDVEHSKVNILTFTFTDDSTVTIEIGYSSLYGLSGIYIWDNEDDP